jgi:hypothetical protein
MLSSKDYSQKAENNLRIGYRTDQHNQAENYSK